MAPKAKVSPLATAFASSRSQTWHVTSRTRFCRTGISNQVMKRKAVVRSMSLDDAIITTDPSFAGSASLPTSVPPPGITPIQEFEPVLNVEAATSFAIIAIIFTLLQLRINAVSNAAKRRSSALEALRVTESLQLSASDVGVNPSDRPTEEQVVLAKKEYEMALREEMDLRTILPGVRIVAPNDPKRDEEERAAAKRFLGWGDDEFGYDPKEDATDNNALGLEGGNSDAEKNQTTGLSNSANLILLGVASMLSVLLLTLSFDPMAADQVFTTLGGSPPSDLPLSSW
eukprot:CAMPEP_0183715554 /NCGR_PEP_ID=MMETSP0737-20130205/9718_1 /TAXON_ID=385413 /ORGANISM="Thalassiosira miniscula, Strain CCMP1093" /LENGTH=285 /DNA_ID=CAMNT_0025944655 /DNA_START=109 /DNA_END=966 /DNA_ORIENTATION=+